MNKLILAFALITASAFAQDQTPNPWAPYAVPEAVTVCQMDMTQTPPVASVDEVTGLPRCFVVPVSVSASVTKFLLTQTSGLDADNHVVYQYASWWDYIVKFFINQLVMPMLDKFPPPNLETAKANAAAAAAAVDAAKNAILSGQQQ